MPHLYACSPLKVPSSLPMFYLATKGGLGGQEEKTNALQVLINQGLGCILSISIHWKLFTPSKVIHSVNWVHINYQYLTTIYKYNCQCNIFLLQHNKGDSLVLLILRPLWLATFLWNFVTKERGTMVSNNRLQTNFRTQSIHKLKTAYWEHSCLCMPWMKDCKY